MGTIIRELVEADESCELAGIVGIETMDTLAERAPEADVVIDFSHKDMLPHVEAYVHRTNAALVSPMPPAAAFFPDSEFNIHSKRDFYRNICGKHPCGYP